MAERPEDLNLPLTVVTRIIKEAMPDGVNVSKEARLAISKAASVFILYATSCSNNFALKGKRKTIGAQDIISAMEEMEFEQFVDPLNQCLQAYRQGQLDKKNAAAEKKKKSLDSTSQADDDSQGKPSDGSGDGPVNGMDTVENGDDNDEEDADENENGDKDETDDKDSDVVEISD